MGGHKPDDKIPLQRVDPAQQFRKHRAAAQILAIGVDVLTQERDLPVSTAGQITDLREDILHIPAALTAAHVRHNTVAAKIIAAVHNGHKRLKAAVPYSGNPLRNHTVPHRDPQHALPLAEHGIEHLGQLVRDVRAKDQIHKRKSMLHPLGHMLLLHHTAAHGDHHVRALRLELLERADIPDYAVLRMLAHGACVKENEVRLLRAVAKAVSHTGEQALDVLTVRDVPLAAIGVHKGHRAVCIFQRQKLADFI